MKYIIILIFIFTYFLGYKEMGYSVGSSVITHFTYSFQHVNLIHLILNCIAFISVFKILQKALSSFLIFTYSYSIAIIASFFSEYSLPTVGSSGIIYAMIGQFISTSIIGKKLKITDYKRFFLYIACIIVSLLLSSVKENINNFCHITALTLGCLVGILDSYFNKS